MLPNKSPFGSGGTVAAWNREGVAFNRVVHLHGFIPGDDASTTEAAISGKVDYLVTAVGLAASIERLFHLRLR